MSNSSDSEDEQLVLSTRKHKISKNNNNDRAQRNITQNNTDEIVYEFGKNKRVRIYQYKGMKLVDIRAMYYNNFKELMPTKKGISLTKNDFLELCDLLEDIKKKL